MTHDPKALPEWGSLPLDQYMLAQWDENGSISDEQQRLRISRSYVSTWSAEREWYRERAKKGEVQFTTDQISRILEPFREPALRHAAQQLSSRKGRFVWLRTDYEHDEQREALLQHLTSSYLYESTWSEYLWDDKLMLSDARYYNVGTQWRRVLDFLPEIIECKIPDWPGEYRDEIRFFHERVKRDYMEWDTSFYEEDESDDEVYRIMEGETEHDITLEQAEARLFKTRVVDCHALACETILFVEDAQTYATDPNTFHILWLDDRATVIKDIRERRPRMRATFWWMWKNAGTIRPSCTPMWGLTMLAGLGVDHLMPSDLRAFVIRTRPLNDAELADSLTVSETFN